jgi:hypothetical protein
MPPTQNRPSKKSSKASSDDEEEKGARFKWDDFPPTGKVYPSLNSKQTALMFKTLAQDVRNVVKLAAEVASGKDETRNARDVAGYTKALVARLNRARLHVAKRSGKRAPKATNGEKPSKSKSIYVFSDLLRDFLQQTNMGNGAAKLLVISPEHYDVTGTKKGKTAEKYISMANEFLEEGRSTDREEILELLRFHSASNSSGEFEYVASQKVGGNVFSTGETGNISKRDATIERITEIVNAYEQALAELTKGEPLVYKKSDIAALVTVQEATLNFGDDISFNTSEVLNVKVGIVNPWKLDSGSVEYNTVACEGLKLSTLGRLIKSANELQRIGSGIDARILEQFFEGPPVRLTVNRKDITYRGDGQTLEEIADDLTRNSITAKDISMKIAQRLVDPKVNEKDTFRYLNYVHENSPKRGNTLPPYSARDHSLSNNGYTSIRHLFEIPRKYLDQDSIDLLNSDDFQLKFRLTYEYITDVADAYDDYNSVAKAAEVKDRKDKKAKKAATGDKSAASPRRKSRSPKRVTGANLLSKAVGAVRRGRLNRADELEEQAEELLEEAEADKEAAEELSERADRLQDEAEVLRRRSRSPSRGPSRGSSPASRRGGALTQLARDVTAAAPKASRGSSSSGSSGSKSPRVLEPFGRVGMGGGRPKLGKGSGSLSGSIE